jgi:hypothetical protein
MATFPPERGDARAHITWSCPYCDAVVDIHEVMPWALIRACRHGRANFVSAELEAVIEKLDAELAAHVEATHPDKLLEFG